MTIIMRRAVGVPRILVDRRRFFSSAPYSHHENNNSSNNDTTIVVALSGGVDSSVAAALLQQQQQQQHADGVVVRALHMSNWNAVASDDDTLPSCSSEADYKDAAAVAQHLQLPLQRVYFESQYFLQVFEPFLQNMEKHGKIGNPDIDCNRYIKFGAMRDYCIKQYGPNVKIATGHYARLWHRRRQQQHNTSIPEYLEAAIEQDAAENDWVLRWGCTENHTNCALPLLLAAADKSKDQSYFLSGCSSQSLSNVVFPLGELFKKQQPNISTTTTATTNPTVRDLAASFSLPTASRRESMGICFVGKRKSGFSEFIAEYLPRPTQPVRFVDIETAQCIGQTENYGHAILYAVGQGAKVGGSREKYFVVEICKDTNVVFVCPGTHHPALYADSLELDRVQWMIPELPRPLRKSKHIRLKCRIRHLQQLMDCTVVSLANGKVRVDFDLPVRGIAPGQMAVFYACDGLVCLGGAPISKRGATYWEDQRTLPNDVIQSGLNDISVLKKTRKTDALVIY